MNARHLIEAAAKAGLSLTVEGPDLVVEADSPIPVSLLAELRRQKPKLIAALTETETAPLRFSELYATEADYARALIRYAQQDGLSLTVKDGGLVIAVTSKNDADLLSELRAHEGAIIQAIWAGAGADAISIIPPRPAEAFRPPILQEPPFGLDQVPDRYRAAWEAFLTQCPAGGTPHVWQAAIFDAATLFGSFGALIDEYRWAPGDLFDVPRDGRPDGVIWFIKGSPVVAVGRGMVQCQDGRIWRRAAR
jgi:hypothetical protein